MKRDVAVTVRKSGVGAARRELTLRPGEHTEWQVTRAGGSTQPTQWSVLDAGGELQTSALATVP